MSRVILKYRNIAQGKMKSIYLEFNPAIHDIKGNSVRYECLNLEIYTNPENSHQFKHNKTVEEIAETIRCERYLQLVRHDYSFLAKARLDEDFLEYFRLNGDCHGAKYQSSRKRVRDAAFFLIIMLVTFAATLLNPQKYVSSRTIQKCVEHVSTST